jgi:hypothetical protein
MDTLRSLQQKVEDIVRRGGQVRRGVAAAVTSAVHGAHEATEGLVDVLRATLAGAARGAAAAAPADRGNTLRAVVDGLGDGLATTAHAVELTLREAVGASARFAREDVERLTGAFASLSSGFVDQVGAAAATAGAQATGQAEALAAHAAATLRRIVPSFAAAVEAAGSDPIALGRDALAAGAAAARGAAGAFFTALGKKLQELGGAVDPRDENT